LGQVAIYCRVSTDDQSCERQERDLRAFARRADHKRPERTKVLALARAHEIDAILVTELSRWGRSTHDLSRRSTTCTAGKLASCIAAE
jgi:putative DNA-invertase from lambdoid prophage Rac